MIVRHELPEDRAAIHEVHSLAGHKGHAVPAAEATLWDLLQEGGDVRRDLSFVATVDGRVVAHAGCSRADLAGREVVALGPVGVLPDHQGRGVGSAVVEAVVAAADAAGEPTIILLGEPHFYGRFGFELAVPLGVVPPNPEWIGGFQLRRLAAWDPGLVGDFRYAPAFSAVS